jgi:hypothetical protein
MISNNNTIGFISKDNVINLLWKDNNIQNIGLPKQDGQYLVRLIDSQGEALPNAPDQFFNKIKLIKIQNQIKIYLIIGNTRRLFWKIKVKDEQIVKVNKEQISVSGVITDFLKSQCSDLVQVMNAVFEDLNIQRKFTSQETTAQIIVDNKFGNDEVIEKNKRILHNRIKKDAAEVKNKLDINFNNDKATQAAIIEHMVGKTFPVFGAIQSGKTNFMITSAVWFALNGKSSIIVVRNYTDDSDQIEFRIKSYNKLLQKSLTQAGLPSNLFSIETVNENKINSQVLSGETPKIMISLCNRTALQKITSKITEQENRKYVLFIDEADLLHKTVIGTELTNKGEKAVSVELDFLQVSAFCTFAVTGTVLDNILKDGVKPQDLIVLKCPTTYKNHSNFLVEYLEKPCKFTTNVNHNILENDPNITSFLDDFIRLKPINTFYRELSPNYCLMRVSNVIKPMNNLFDFIADNYKEIATIVYTGEGTKLYHKNLENIDRITLSNNIKSEKNGKYHIFKKGGNPQFVLEYLKKNGGVKKYPHIITIAGDLASRGISYGSADFSECVKNQQLGWHLTRMYATFCKNTDVPEMLQITGRLCISANDGIPLYLHMKEEDHETMLKSYHLTQELCFRVKKNQALDIMTKDFLTSTPVFKNKIPKGRDLTKFEKFKPNKSSQQEDSDSGGWSTDSSGKYIEKKVKKQIQDPFGNDIEIEENLPTIKNCLVRQLETEEFETVEEYERKTGLIHNINEIDNEEFTRLTKKMFPKWSKNDSKIANFMKNLDPYKKYTENEIKELCTLNGIVNIGQLTNIKIGTNGFGTILQKNNNCYRLYPCLINDFLTYF